MTTFHAPIFKNEVRGILEQTEDLKEHINLTHFGKFPKLRSNDSFKQPGDLTSNYAVKKRDSRYLNNLKEEFNEWVEPLSGSFSGKMFN
jgi:hypothetical protein